MSDTPSGDLLKEPLQLGDRSVSIGASVGIAIFPNDAPDADSLCRVADLRMYEEKRGSGRREKHVGPSVPGTSSTADSLRA